MTTIQIAESTGAENYLAALASCGAGSLLSLDPERETECGGLLIPGGGDVAPSLYRQKNEACFSVNPSLDQMQFALLERYRKAGKPVLGICRGHQVINVFFGGSLIQNLPTAERHKRKNDADEIHLTRAETGSFLAELYGTRFPVNSAHHQGIDALGTGLAAVQFADDGVIEGIRHESLPVFGVQWHPERMTARLRNRQTVDGGVLLQSFVSFVSTRRFV